ncbi:hypothetical protein GCM10028805_27220 [Spirosoma harenae]
MATYILAKEVLNVEVSCFANYNTAGNPKPVNLYTWLTNSKYREKVELIRQLTDKFKRDEVKATLPAITPSGVFIYRQASDLVHHSGVLQFDIDLKDNPRIRNYADLKTQIAKLPFVAYCGLSVSGTGYWGLVPIAYPEWHNKHFDALKRVFAYYGIIIDNKPRNVASLRGYSYDPDAYFAEKVMLFDIYDEPRPGSTRDFAPSNNANTERERVESCIREIRRRSIDITSGYNYWYAIGCDLASSFGEGGREYFHVISQFNPEYNPANCDRQYSHCLRSYKEVQLKTFFSRCRDAGINWKEITPYELPAGAIARVPISKPKSQSPGKNGRSKNETNGRIEPTGRVAANIDERLTTPMKIKNGPNPTQSEVLLKLPQYLEDYPTERYQSKLPDPSHTIKQQTAASYFNWQRTQPPFNQLGLATSKGKTG